MRREMALPLPARGIAPGRAQRPVGLLLVALPVLLLAWLIVYPIFSAVITTVFVRQPDGTSAVSLASYAFFFSDAYSLANLWVTLWTTLVCGILLLVIGLPIALYLRFSQGACRPMCRGWRSFRCSCRRSSCPMH
jgi:putative spermidine/putrescine transport system permease protein